MAVPRRPSSTPLEDWSEDDRASTRSSSERPRRGNGRHARSRASSPMPTPPQCSPTASIHGSPSLKPALKQQGGLSKQFGSTSSPRFIIPTPTPRDSIELARHRLEDNWPMIDPSLSSTRDSLVLTKQRFEKYPKSQLVVDECTGQVKFGGLSPIMDASPPDPRAYWAARRGQDMQERERRWQREIRGHPENDHECPIYEMERPRSRRLMDSRT